MRHNSENKNEIKQFREIGYFFAFTIVNENTFVWIIKCVVDWKCAHEINSNHLFHLKQCHMLSICQVRRVQSVQHEWISRQNKTKQQHKKKTGIMTTNERMIEMKWVEWKKKKRFDFTNDRLVFNLILSWNGFLSPRRQ